MQTYDQKIQKLFYYWLLASFFMVFVMVIVGGLTRLTNSGLSITEWELFKGILPPLNPEKWNNYFLLYKSIPQYQLINNNMNINEFKVIFYWEYFHRFLGRVIGLFFLIPIIYFYIKKKIDKRYLKTCLIIGVLIVLQGAIGWYMVKSGLVNNVTVSHYRLSLHLVIAFIILLLIFWILLNFKKRTFKVFFLKKKNRIIFYFLFFLILIQIILGAFVSGLDAGRIYQTWPLMDQSYFPDDVSINKIYDFFDFNNHALIQFYHRNVAYIISIYIFILSFIILKKKKPDLLKPLSYLVFFLILQIILGIIVLTSGLNIYLASAHQICGLLLTISVINLYYYYIN